MKRKKVLNEYFDFTKRSRLAIFTLIIILIVSTFSPRFFRLKKNKELSLADTAWIAAIKRLEIKDGLNKEDSFEQDNPYNYQFDRPEGHPVKPVTGELFHFDPNTASIQEWERLGIKDKTIRTIQNYLEKGGHFKTPEDLKKIYGLRDDEYQRLFPFIRIQGEVKNSETAGYKEPATYLSKRSYTIADINTADTTAFISLPGIGSKLATRIINFREKLGGFYSIDQVKETYGLPDSTFQKIKPYLQANSNAIKKININKATADELKTHPYIKYNIANPIIAYRKQHGPFEKIEDIKKVMVVTDEMYEKISPYLTTQ
jgi:competence ComEA-like helix-hairpin-helix protein